MPAMSLVALALAFLKVLSVVVIALAFSKFVILLDALKSDDAEDVAERVISAIEKPYTIENNTLYSNASIGISVCGTQYKNADEELIVIFTYLQI